MKLLKVLDPMAEFLYHVALSSEKESRGLCHNRSFNGCDRAVWKTYNKGLYAKSRFHVNDLIEKLNCMISSYLT
jgi:hypothetical protein